MSHDYLLDTTRPGVDHISPVTKPNPIGALFASQLPRLYSNLYYKLVLRRRSATISVALYSVLYSVDQLLVSLLQY